MAVTSPSKVAQPFSPVKSKVIIDTSHSPDSMIHHKPPQLPEKIIVSYKSIERGNPYGVSQARRVLSPGLLLRKYDYVRDCLENVLQQSTSKREVTLRLLRLWAYYGKVYPKASQVAEVPGCSRATFWRTIKELEDLGLVHRIRRYVIRPHAQISNLYRLDRLVLLLARYLAEHGTQFWEKWLKPYLRVPGRVFWGSLIPCPGIRAGPFLAGLQPCLAL